MRRVPDTFLPPVPLDQNSETPIYRQIYAWLRKAILDGKLRAGQRVPSTRSLAAELEVSRIPVLNAYEQLLAEGYLEAAVGAGTSCGPAHSGRGPESSHRQVGYGNRGRARWAAADLAARDC